ncbi:MAG: MCE family protein [Chromatiales bacterium]|nr:MCE family protein [Chromatiales bacterium]
MRRDNVNYLLVGGFVLLMLAALVVALYLLTGRSGPSDRYHAYYANVAGIRFGTPVYYEGFQIGQVDAVSPEEGARGLRFRVDFAVQRGWKIPADSVAQPRASGLLGTVSIHVLQGVAGLALNPGSEITGRAPANLLESVNDVATDLSDLTRNSLRPLITTLARALDGTAAALDDHGPLMLAKFSSLLAKLDSDLPGLLAGLTGLSAELQRDAPRALAGVADLATRFRGEVPHVRQKLEDLVASLGRTAERLEQMFSAKRVAGMERMLGNLESASADIGAFSRGLGASGKRLDALLLEMDTAVGENRPDLRASVADLRRILATLNEHAGAVAYHLEGTSRNMNEFSRQIRQNPGLLLGGRQSGEK